MNRKLPQTFTARLFQCGLAVVALAGVAHADTLKVPVGGPIQPTIDQAMPGDIVLIPGGTYFETLLIPPGKDNLVLKGAGKVVIDGLPNGKHEGSIITVTGTGVRIENLTLRHGNSSMDAPPAHQADGYGIYAEGNDIAIVKVTVLRTWTSGVYIDGDRAVLSGCVFDAPGYYGFELYGDDASVTGVTVKRTYENGGLVEGERARITGNKFLDHDGHGLVLIGNSARVEKNSFMRGSGDSDGFISGGDLTIDGEDAVVIANTFVTASRVYALFVLGSGAVILKNKLANIGESGIAVVGDNASIEGNAVTGGTRYSVAIAVGGNGCDIVGNKVTDVPGGAIGVTGNQADVWTNTIKGGGGWNVAAITLLGDDNFAQGNSITDVADLGFEVTGTMNVISKNKVSGSLTHGIAIYSKSHFNTVEFNAFSNLQGDGIQNWGFETSVQGNKVSNARDAFTNATSEGATLHDLGGNTPALPSAPGDVPEPEVDA